MLVGGTLLDEAGPDSTFASVMSALEPEQRRVQTASLSARVELGGAAVLEPGFEISWRTVLLWAALIAAVAIVASMAVKLARDVGSS